MTDRFTFLSDSYLILKDTRESDRSTNAEIPLSTLRIFVPSSYSSSNSSTSTKYRILFKL